MGPVIYDQEGGGGWKFWTQVKKKNNSPFALQVKSQPSSDLPVGIGVIVVFPCSFSKVVEDTKMT